MVIPDYPQCCTEPEKEFLSRVKAAANNSIPGIYQDQIEIRAALVCWILKNTSQVEGHITRLNLPNGKIVGPLDLSLNAIGIIVCFQSCTFDSMFGIADCRFASLELRDCRGTMLDARRIEIVGRLTVQDGTFESINLSGANVHGEVAISGTMGKPAAAATGNEDVKAMDADGLRCEGSVDLSNLNARGEVRLNGANIGRDLRCHGIRVSNPNMWSLSAAGATVEGSTYFGPRRPMSPVPAHPPSNPSTYDGGIHLEGITVRGDLDMCEVECTASRFVLDEQAKKVPSKAGFEGHLEAVRAGGAKIGGSIKLKKLRTLGTVWLADAEVGGNFDCSDASFQFPGETALWADGIQVTGTTYISTFERRSKVTNEALTSAWTGGHTNGILRFANASLKRGLTVANFHFSGSGEHKRLRHTDPDMLVTETDSERIYGKKDAKGEPTNDVGFGACGIYAPSCKIRGRFIFHSISVDGDNNRTRLLSLLNSNVDVLDYHPRFARGDYRGAKYDWDTSSRLDLNNFVYREIAYIDAERASHWLNRLDRRYAPGNLVPCVLDSDRFP